MIQSLKKSSDFLFLSKKGKKIKPTKWLTIHYVETESPGIYIGITASRKVGSAVLRNKLKRWVRNSVRAIKFSHKNGRKIVFVFRPQTAEFYGLLTFAEFKKATLEIQNI